MLVAYGLFEAAVQCALAVAVMVEAACPLHCGDGAQLVARAGALRLGGPTIGAHNASWAQLITEGAAGEFLALPLSGALRVGRSLSGVLSGATKSKKERSFRTPA
jgi:hypothetical protein